VILGPRRDLRVALFAPFVDTEGKQDTHSSWDAGYGIGKIFGLKEGTPSVVLQRVRNHLISVELYAILGGAFVQRVRERMKTRDLRFRLWARKRS
jgi:hypothetical protein